MGIWCSSLGASLGGEYWSQKHNINCKRTFLRVCNLLSVFDWRSVSKSWFSSFSLSNIHKNSIVSSKAVGFLLLHASVLYVFFQESLAEGQADDSFGASMLMRTGQGLVYCCPELFRILVGQTWRMKKLESLLQTYLHFSKFLNNWIEIKVPVTWLLAHCNLLHIQGCSHSQGVGRSLV